MLIGRVAFWTHHLAVSTHFNSF